MCNTLDASGRIYDDVRKPGWQSQQWWILKFPDSRWWITPQHWRLIPIIHIQISTMVHPSSSPSRPHSSLIFLYIRTNISSSLIYLYIHCFLGDTCNSLHDFLYSSNLEVFQVIVIFPDFFLSLSFSFSCLCLFLLSVCWKASAHLICFHQLKPTKWGQRSPWTRNHLISNIFSLI